MAGALFPDARFRSPTALQTRSDIRDELIYSALRLGDGASGNLKTFAVPQGQTIPSQGSLGGLATHQTAYSPLTTNLVKAGEFGSTIGDASVRAIGLTIEQASTKPDGTISTYGATAGDVTEILSKCSFSLHIGDKKQIEQPVWGFPALGGAVANGFGVSTTANLTTLAVGLATNGVPGSGRRLKIPLMIGRTDSVAGTLLITGILDLYGINTQSVLIWTGLTALIRGDVR